MPLQLAELRQQLRTLTAEVDAAERRTLTSSSMLALPFLALVALLVMRMQIHAPTPALVPDLRHALSQAVQYVLCHQRLLVRFEGFCL